MSEEAAGSIGPKGKPAIPGSGRREFRRFRPRKPKDPNGTAEDDGQKPKPKPNKLKSERTEDGNAGTETAATAENATQSNPTIRKMPRPRFCRFYNTAMGCKMGDACPYRHVPKKQPTQPEELPQIVEAGTVTEGTPAEPVQVVLPPVGAEPTPETRQARVVTPRTITVGEDARGSEQQTKLKESDIAYLRRRFKGTSVIARDESSVVLFTYGIPEPYWPFDVRSVRLALYLRSHHPIDPPIIDCPQADNGGLPQLLAKHIASQLQTEIDTKHTEASARGVFGAYAKWIVHKMDKMILKLFIDGLRKAKMVIEAERAGITVVMPTTDKKNDMENEEEMRDKDEGNDHDDGKEKAFESLSIVEEDESEESELETSDLPKIKDQQSGPPKERPTIEMIIAWTNASGNVATLEADALRFVLKCARCGEIREEDARVDGGKRAARCLKCAHAQSIVVVRSLVHDASSTLALLTAVGCRPIDCVLLRSHLRFVCLPCNKVDTVQDLSFGATHKSWCRGCHALIEFVIRAARFQGLHAADEDEEAARSVPKVRKVKPKETGSSIPIVDGQPLPGQGTCKHYKKSYRWFRFPCCGRLFPCDTCHEETVKGEHEMKVANRMVCGHCSHEQPYLASKPCIRCEEATTRKRSQFWEGGKGCRDQTAMNKNDVHKFAGSRKKTVSKKNATNLVEKKKS